MERLKPDDIFILNLEGEEFIVPSPEKKLIKSQSTTIFISAFNGTLNKIIKINYVFLQVIFVNKFRA